MSCDAAAALAMKLHLAAYEPDPASARLLPVSTAPAPLLREALFSDIVARAAGLEKEVDRWRAAPPAAVSPAFEARLAALSEQDMKGHVTLAARGTDGDLKCILKGIAQDLPKKLDALKTARADADRRSAAEELYYLLRDNVEVVTTPAKVQSSDAAAL